MSRDFFPRRDAELIAWLSNASARLQTDPQRYGVPEPIAADLVAKGAAFLEAYRQNADPGTRTRVGTTRKNDARRELERVARTVNRLAHAVADGPEALIELGLNVNKPGRGPAIARPAARPVVQVMSVVGRRVHLRLGEDVASSFFRKPKGVASAVIYVCASDATPDSESAWACWGTTSTANLTLTFDDPAMQPGAKIWFAAAWANPRGVRGAMSDPTYAYLQYGLSTPPGLQAA